jgi:hypothetical protein
MSEQKIYPVYNPQVILEHFSDEEKSTIHKFSGKWYIFNLKE